MEPATQTTTPTIVVDDREAARITGLARATLQTMRSRGAGPPFVRLGLRRVGYRVADLERWIADRIVASTAERTAAETASATSTERPRRRRRVGPEAG